jgi:predicted transcriptional regulator
MRKQTNEGRTLSKRRKLCGLTQHALAEQSGVNVQRITFAETGRIALDDSELNRIRVALKQRAQKVFDSVAGV